MVFVLINHWKFDIIFIKLFEQIVSAAIINVTAGLANLTMHFHKLQLLQSYGKTV